MCRLIVYKGRGRRQAIVAADLVVTPTHSIIKQSFDCQERSAWSNVPPSLNADGFGLGWYEMPDEDGPSGSGSSATGAVGTTSASGSAAGAGAGAGAGATGTGASADSAAAKRYRRRVTPGMFRSTSPAWNNDNLYRLSSKIRSPLIFCHVRAASPGSIISEANCHPFACGKYMFMHNGGLTQWNKIRRKAIAYIGDSVLPSLRGTTDSEHAFAVFLTIVERHFGLEAELSPEQLQDCVEETMNTIIAWLDEVGSRGSMLNYAVTDGRHVIATRYAHRTSVAASLYFTSGSEWLEHPAGSGSFRVEQRDRREHVVLVASEPLDSIAGDWLEVPRNSILRVSADMNVRVSPMHERKPVLDLSSAPLSRATKRQRVCEDGASVSTESTALSSLGGAGSVSTAKGAGASTKRIHSAAAPDEPPQSICVELDLSDDEADASARPVAASASPASATP